MKALILTSNILRHKYFARAVARCFDAPMALIEEKTNYYAKQCDQLTVVRDHFESIARAEKFWLSDSPDATFPEMCHVGDINAPDLVAWAL